MIWICSSSVCKLTRRRCIELCTSVKFLLPGSAAVDRTQLCEHTVNFFPHPFIYPLPIRTPFIFFTLVISSPPGTNKPRCQCSCSYSSVTCRSFFRVRIGPEVLQLSPPFVLYVPGLMQARRLRLNRHRRQLSTRCTGNREQTIRC
jgi:hypothetical protein